MQNIIFNWNNKDYEVSLAAYNHNVIVLPDKKTILRVNSWAESMPPQPDGLHIVTDFQIETVLNLLNNSVLAKEVTQKNTTTLIKPAKPYHQSIEQESILFKFQEIWYRFQNQTPKPSKIIVDNNCILHIDKWIETDSRKEGRTLYKYLDERYLFLTDIKVPQYDYAAFEDMLRGLNAVTARPAAFE